MNGTVIQQWEEANQRYLVASLALVKHALEQYLERTHGKPITTERQQALQQDLQAVAAAMPAPANLETLCETFHLSSFERDVLLLCAGIELDGKFAMLCSTILRSGAQEHAESEPHNHGPFGFSAPTFSLALAALQRAHWDALTPTAPLRCWNLLEIGTGNVLTLSPLRIDEYILHYLTGVPHPEMRLAHLLTPLPVSTGSELVPSQQKIVERLVAAWRHGVDAFASLYERGNAYTSPFPVLQLCGEDQSGQYAIAAAGCAVLGLQVKLMDVSVLPVAAEELMRVMRLWEREAILQRCALLLDCVELDNTDSVRMSVVMRLLQHLRSPLLVLSRQRLAIPGIVRSTLTFDVARPDSSEQRALWQRALLPYMLNGQVDLLAAQFNLSSSVIEAVASEVSTSIRALDDGHTQIGSLLWHECRVRARPRLDGLAQRIEARATWHDLVLPEAQRNILQEILAQVRQRTTVYDTWNFKPGGGSHGLGISALFAGASGTGKTLAAEVLAHALHLDLYRVDLSAVVSKYIGETEKNLRRVFDAAEEGGAVLLFDEADALFGKRSEVKDSHDRYANIEVGYLLQRMEAYRGLAILTTNLRSALDTAFLRRLRFIVQFPFPDMAQRLEIWRAIFPPSLPTSGLDMQKLARLNIAGGNIRNIALNAAFLAAEAGEPLQMKHLLHAAGTEYAKLEKPLTETEAGGWL